MFHSSTHRKHWLFSAEDLKAARAAAHDTGMTSTKKALVEANVDHSKIPEITSDEARVVAKRVEHSVYKFCSDRLVSDRVLATATAYVKRFYIHHSVMHYPDDLVVRLCVFLACKTEESNTECRIMLNLERVKPGAKPHDVTPEMVAFMKQNEVPMIAALNFHLVIHSPLRPLKGFLMDLKTRVPESGLSRVQSQANTTLFSWLCSDVVLLHPPSQIALACLAQVADKEKVNIAEYLLQKVCGGDQPKHTKLAATLTKIQESVHADLAGSEPSNTNEILTRYNNLMKIKANPHSAGGEARGRQAAKRPLVDSDDEEQDEDSDNSDDGAAASKRQKTDDE